MYLRASQLFSLFHFSLTLLSSHLVTFFHKYNVVVFFYDLKPCMGNFDTPAVDALSTTPVPGGLNTCTLPVGSAAIPDMLKFQ